MRERGNRTLYLECNSGISGDMTVAALLDLGADREVLKKVLKSIPVDGFKIRISRVKKAGLDVCDFQVVLDEKHENHDHDMAYLFGSGEEGHDHAHHTHSHEHRALPEILHIIEHTDMTKEAKETAARIFRILAKAEAKAHGVPETEVHFHEVGAVDSIVDIISAAVCLDDLGITQCIVPGLCEGRGTVRCQHGVMSVPVPAVLNIVQEHRLKLSVTDVRGELVTPTGAAIVAAVKTGDDLPKNFHIIKSGMGGGKRAYECPGILRAMLIEEVPEHAAGRENDKKMKKADAGKNGRSGREGKTDTVNLDDNNVINGEGRNNSDVRDDRDVIYKLETDIDDCGGEVLGYVMERLFEAGARDVHYIPVYMKKNRPAYQLNVLCREEQISVLEDIIFAETTTIGIRRQKMERTVLARRSTEVMTELGAADVKECRLPEDQGVRYYPEYESVARLCRMSEKPFREVYRLIEDVCRAKKKDGAEPLSKKSAKGRRFRRKV